MPNMVDYVIWRGDLRMEQFPWNEIDGLLMATLSYLNFHGAENAKGWTLEEACRLELLQPGNTKSYPGRKRAFEHMAKSERFGQFRMHHFIALTDKELEMQFSAMCIDLPDGTVCVAFRGTDNTIVGWRENFNMAYRTRVPGQEAASAYLSRVAEATDRPLRLVGHSKGGNLAVYAATKATPEIQDRIESIWSYDGPGMNLDISQSEAYGRIKGKIHHYIPQTSIIGLLMEYYSPYTVVHSTATGITQHEPMSWQVIGPHFEERDSIDSTAYVLRDTFHGWLENSTPEQRSEFVDALFKFLESTKATKMSDLMNEKLKSLATIMSGRKEVEPETRKAFTRLMGQAITLGFGNAVAKVRGKTDSDSDSGQWDTMDDEEDETDQQEEE